MKKYLKITILMLLLTLLLGACGSNTLQEVSRDIDFSQSSYSHITNGGTYSKSDRESKTEDQKLPYDVDAISCATLTIEGPAMEESVPLAIGDMESYDSILVRGQYKDKNGVRYYEGADLWNLLNDLSEEEGITMTEKAYKVVIKNSNREEIESFTLEEIEAAHNAGRPIILAYGVGSKDESAVAPFVFNGKTDSDHSLGYVSSLKNDDGCLRLVYDTADYGSANPKQFQNAAYVYVCEETTPGFSHTEAGEDSVYSDESLTDYIVSFRGQGLGYELNFTTAQLEALVHKDSSGNITEGGIGYRDSYSLANNSYWYVNEYEGLKLYDLLMYFGMESAEELGTKKAKTTLVSFLASDGVVSSEKFSVETLSYPDAFGFYQKNATDNNDGTYVSTNEDLVDLGYPVLLAYGFNEYPYVTSTKAEGYLSGLSNSGGPFRVIFGKTSYNHHNGSNQVQYVSAVVVGGDIAYSTHLESVDEDLLALGENDFTLKLTANSQDLHVFDEYTINDLEEILYGRKVTANDKNKAQVKKVIDGDVYEGIDLAYIVSETLDVPFEDGISTVSGSVTITLADGALSVDLADIEYGKYFVVFAKNGTPLVETAESAGYVKERTLYPVNDSDPAVYKVDNIGGPVQLITMLGDEVSSASGNEAEYNNNVTGIEVNLDISEAQLIALRDAALQAAIEAENAVPNADIAWNHSQSAEYEDLLDKTFEIEIVNDDSSWSKTYTVAELESYTDIVFRGKYSVMEIGYCEGLDLWKLVKKICGYDSSADGYVAVSDNALEGLADAESVNIVASDAYEIDLLSVFGKDSLENGVVADDGRVLPVLLAYGCKGYPFVASSNDEGYVAEADNTYGPLRIITEKSSQSSMKFCIKLSIKVPGSGEIVMPE